jgi:hypothetical protein
MNITELSLSEIKPYPNNPRKNKKGIAAVKRSIEEFGFTQPLIINAEQVILCGHTRYEAPKELTFAAVPVIVKTELTPQQERAYRIADNRVTQETDWDKWKLRSEFNKLFSDGDYFTGFTQDEISDIMSMDLGFRSEGAMPDELPEVLFPVEIACDEKQWETFRAVQSKMKKKNRLILSWNFAKGFYPRNRKMDAGIGLWLGHPVPLEYSGTTCSHACKYCFARGYGNRKSDYHKCQSLIRNLDKRDNLAAELFKAGHPVLLSNRSDPFCENNYRETLSVLKLLRQFPNGIFLQTKTGTGLEDAIEILEGKENIEIGRASCRERVC